MKIVESDDYGVVYNVVCINDDDALTIERKALIVKRNGITGNAYCLIYKAEGLTVNSEWSNCY